MTRVEKLTNIAVLLACLSVTAAAVRSFIPQAAPPDAAPARPTPKPLIVGEQLAPIEGVTGGRRTLLMVLSSRCQYCTEAMPYYKQLVEGSRAQQKSTQFVALYLLNEDEATMKGYLAQHGLAPDSVVPFPAGLLPRVSGTPTLVLVDEGNVVLGFWRGRLASAGQAEVNQRLGL